MHLKLGHSAAIVGCFCGSTWHDWVLYDVRVPRRYTRAAPPAPPSPPLAEAAQLWSSDLAARNLAANSREQYRMSVEDLSRFLERATPEPRVCDLTPES